MPSKRKEMLAKKKLAKKQSQLKPGGASRYALKKARMAKGWNNPRSPIRVTEVELIA